ncbi:MAG: hypothetical protein WC881_06020 [Elusimicrobiota bacterium]|jgi:hypothetical protein
MQQWDDDALGEINSIEAARLALRGALDTIRDLQALNSKAKAEVQDESARRKLNEDLAAAAAAKAEQLQKQVETWEKERQTRSQDEERWRNAARLEVRAEERARMEETRLQTEAELARLHAELQQMAALNRERGDSQTGALAQLKKLLESREAEVLAARREKEEMAKRVEHDMQLYEQVRQQRDRELSSSLKGRELEIADKDREIAALRAKIEELTKTVEASVREGEKRLLRAEEALRREYQEREARLSAQFAQREGDLQAHWAQLETGLWQRTKEARGKLDQTIDAQFEERTRALADRTQQADAQLAARRQELEADFARRCAESEAAYSANEKRLLQSWSDKEQRFLKNFEDELVREKTEIQESWSQRVRQLDVDHEAGRHDLAREREKLESEFRHRQAVLLDEAARRDAERVRQQDDFTAKKAAELERAFEERCSALRQKELAAQQQYAARLQALEETFARKDAASREEFNTLRQQLLDEQSRAVASEKAALENQLEQKARALQEAYAAKLAELDRFRQTEEERSRSWKAGVEADFAQKQKLLDCQWAARDRDLLTRHDVALEQQRRSFHEETAKLREAFEARLRQIETEALRRQEELKASAEQREREIQGAWLLQEGDTRRRNQEELNALRADYDKSLRIEKERSAAETARIRTELQSRLDRTAEQHRAESDARERALIEKDLLVKKTEEDARSRAGDMQAKLDQLEKQHQESWEDLRRREHAGSQARQALHEQHQKAAAQNELRYLDRERALQALWNQREAEQAALHQAAMEKQHAQFLQELAQRDEAHRQALEEGWKRLDAEYRQKLESLEKDREIKRRKFLGS